MNNIVEWIKTWTLNGDLSILIFIFIAAFLLIASIRLVKYAEIIIIRTKFGGAFIGGVLIAAITSMPELLTEITQGINGHPGAGAADDLGSNAFSAFLIALSALFFYKNKFLNNLDRWTKTSLFISMSLAFTATILMFINKDITIGKEGVYAIGIIPLLFFLLYIYSLRLTYKYGDVDESGENSLSKKDKFISIRLAIILFSIFSLIIIVLSIGLNLVADVIIDTFSIKTNSVGGLALAITTSLPEVVAFIIFLRRKQPIAAISSLIGSHIFNVGIQLFGDLSYSSESTYNSPELFEVWPIALITGIIMFFIGVHTIIGKKLTKPWMYYVAPITASLTYIVGWTLIIAL